MTYRVLYCDLKALFSAPVIRNISTSFLFNNLEKSLKQLLVG